MKSELGLIKIEAKVITTMLQKSKANLIESQKETLRLMDDLERRHAAEVNIRR